MAKNQEHGLKVCGIKFCKGGCENNPQSKLYKKVSKRSGYTRAIGSLDGVLRLNSNGDILNPAHDHNADQDERLGEFYVDIEDVIDWKTEKVNRLEKGEVIECSEDVGYFLGEAIATRYDNNEISNEESYNRIDLDKASLMSALDKRIEKCKSQDNLFEATWFLSLKYPSDIYEEKFIEEYFAKLSDEEKDNILASHKDLPIYEQYKKIEQDLVEDIKIYIDKARGNLKAGLITKEDICPKEDYNKVLNSSDTNSDIDLAKKIFYEGDAINIGVVDNGRNGDNGFANYVLTQEAFRRLEKENPQVFEDYADLIFEAYGKRK